MQFRWEIRYEINNICLWSTPLISFFFRPWAGEELRLSPCRLIFTFFFSIAGRVLRWTLTASLRRFVDESRHFFFSPRFFFNFFITQDRFNRNGRINSPSSCCLDGGGETGSDSLPTVTKSSGMRGEWGIFMFKRQELCILEISMLVWTDKKKRLRRKQIRCHIIRHSKRWDLWYFDSEPFCVRGNAQGVDLVNDQIYQSANGGWLFFFFPSSQDGLEFRRAIKNAQWPSTAGSCVINMIIHYRLSVNVWNIHPDRLLSDAL